MPMYMLRWENGDVSFAYGANKVEAFEDFDQVGDPSGGKIRVVRHFAVHFKLNDTGDLELEDLDFAHKQELYESEYPAIEEAVNRLIAEDNFHGFDQLTEAGKEIMGEAVTKERMRVRFSKGRDRTAEGYSDAGSRDEDEPNSDCCRS